MGQYETSSSQFPSLFLEDNLKLTKKKKTFLCKDYPNKSRSMTSPLFFLVCNPRFSLLTPVIMPLFCYRKVFCVSEKHISWSPVSELHNQYQERKLSEPKYKVLRKEYRGHNRMFVVECITGDFKGLGKGKYNLHWKYLYFHFYLIIYSLNKY